MGCDLQVDVNGEQVFMVNKKIFVSFSVRFSKVFGRGGTRNPKVIFHNFPGGAEGFELLARFCYSNGRTEINPCNIVLLNCAANSMDMNGDSSVTFNLITQTEMLLGWISHWTWSQLLMALKHCQDLVLSTANSWSISHRVLDCLVQKLVLSNFASPFASSSETSSFKSNFSQTACWWFENLVFLNPNFMQKLVRMMISQQVDHATISKFLLYYQKLKAFGAAPTEKRSIVEVIIGLVCFLDISSLPFKFLFNIYQVALNAKVSKEYKNRLEILIGSQLDRATIDYMLVPSPPGKNYSYDVSMVQRFVKAFLVEGGFHLVLPSRLNKVSELMDLYLPEVAPDSHLNPSKLSALVMLLPDCARQTHDRLYRTMDMYLEGLRTTCGLILPKVHDFVNGEGGVLF